MLEEESERLVKLEIRLERVCSDLEKLVTRQEFAPVKLIAYGLAGGILTAVLSAVVFNVLVIPK